MVAAWLSRRHVGFRGTRLVLGSINRTIDVRVRVKISWRWNFPDSPVDYDVWRSAQVGTSVRPQASSKDEWPHAMHVNDDGVVSIGTFGPALSRCRFSWVVETRWKGRSPRYTLPAVLWASVAAAGEGFFFPSSCYLYGLRDRLYLGLINSAVFNILNALLFVYCYARSVIYCVIFKCCWWSRWMDFCTFCVACTSWNFSADNFVVHHIFIFLLETFLNYAIKRKWTGVRASRASSLAYMNMPSLESCSCVQLIQQRDDIILIYNWQRSMFR